MDREPTRQPPEGLRWNSSRPYRGGGHDRNSRKGFPSQPGRRRNLDPGPDPSGNIPGEIHRDGRRIKEHAEGRIRGSHLCDDPGRPRRPGGRSLHCLPHRGVRRAEAIFTMEVREDQGGPGGGNVGEDLPDARLQGRILPADHRHGHGPDRRIPQRPRDEGLWRRPGRGPQDSRGRGTDDQGHQGRGGRGHRPGATASPAESVGRP